MTQLYSYQVREQNGKSVKGMLRADCLVSAARMLQERNYIITDLKPASKIHEILNIIQSNPIITRINSADLALYCRQFATMLEAGVPITNSLKVLASQADNRILAETSEEILEHLKEGKTFAESTVAYKFVFPEIFNRLVVVGEISGNLGNSFEQLSTHFEKEYSLQETVKSALFYPVLVLGISLITAFVLVFFVLPQLVAVMSLQDISVPLVTKIVLSIAGFIYGNWAFLFLGIIFGFLGVKHALGKEKCRETFDSLKLRVPVIGPLYRKEISCRFSRNLAILLRSGVSIVHSLEIVADVVGNRVPANIIREAKTSITVGAGLAEPLSEGNIFPPMLIQMIRVGEASGSLENLLERTADFYDREIIKSLERLNSLIEPVLILFVGGIIAVILFSVVLPVLEVMNSI